MASNRIPVGGLEREDMRSHTLFPSLVVAGAILAAGTWPSAAQDGWTYPILEFKPPRADATAAAPLPSLSKFTALTGAQAKAKNKICLLLPQTQDAVFIAYVYGATDEAKRLGQALTVFDAGGYEHDADQRSQFENCVTLGAKAILIEPVNPSGWETDIANARKAGIKVINVTEPLASAVDGRSVIDFRVNGGLLGELIAKDHPAGSPEVTALVLPGAAGIPFVEDTVTGFKSKVAGSAVKVADVIYAGMTYTEQLKVVEDALVAHPDVDYIVGNAMAISQAINVLAQRGITDKVKLLVTYLDPDILEAIKEGKILAGTAESSVMLKRIAVNLAVGAVNGDTVVHDVVPEVGLVTKKNAGDPAIAKQNFPPAGWKPIFKVD